VTENRQAAEPTRHLERNHGAKTVAKEINGMVADCGDSFCGAVGQFSHAAGCRFGKPVPTPRRANRDNLGRNPQA
jgi:hypothetical protein